MAKKKTSVSLPDWATLVETGSPDLDAHLSGLGDHRRHGLRRDDIVEVLDVRAIPEGDDPGCAAA